MPLTVLPAGADAAPDDEAEADADVDVDADDEADVDEEADGDVALLADELGAVLAAPEVDEPVDAAGVLLPPPHAAKIGNNSTASATQACRLVRCNFIERNSLRWK